MRDKNGRFVKGNVPWHKGKKGIKKPNSGSFKKGQIPHNKDKEYPDVSVDAIHLWVIRKLGTPKKCAHCGKYNKENRNGYSHIQYANIDHKYRRVLDDYIPLCVKCHRAYDKKK